ncbi:DNA primase [Dongia mobilis]|uniref:DNA primase n=1 Tax=Dongia mobilis TaxID=578943 RepID=A0A4V3DEW9_9PROT|nr:DNA primase [Dongia mobilis]TDQ83390.1 DNA primase [Dongia mobilis]
MALLPQFLEELRRRVSITDVIGRRVRLNRRGLQATGLCPFHNEKSPSFHVYEGPDEPHYHCFGCGAHGDVITFVMETEGLQFRDAVEKLAGEAGLEIPRDNPEARARAERQDTLAGVMELAAKFFESQLGGSAGRAGLEYLKGRGLDPETIRRFRLGFAPDGFEALKARLARENIPEALALEAGLLVRNDETGRIYDRFRGRVMFPIMDAKGRVIAFGGRALGDEKPKYLNSPETPLFHKGRTLYNLNQAQKPARDRNEIIVVEGYMDVIALAEGGFPHAVAPLGTALTEDHIQLLWRFAAEPILCFDGDAAGRKAAARSVERVLPILKPGLSLRFAWLPQGQDPDDLIRGASGLGDGSGAMRQVLEKAQALVDVFWAEVLAGRVLDTPERRSGFRRDLLAAISRIADKGVQEDYRREILARLDQAFGGGGPALRSGPRPPRLGRFGDGRTVGTPFQYPNPGGEAARRGTAGVRRLPYEVLLAVVINHPDLLHRHHESVALIAIPDRQLDKLKGALLDLATRHPDLDANEFKNHLMDLGFSGAIETLVRHTGTIRFALPSAGLAQAEAGLLHVMAILRETEIEVELAAAARALEEDMSQDNLDRFQAAQQQKLEAESRRRDLDLADFDPLLKT